MWNDFNEKEVVIMIKYISGEIFGRPMCERSSIENTNNPILEKRELLKITLNHPGEKTVNVIMMNPSEADTQNSDKTVNRVINFFYKQPIIVENELGNNYGQIISDIKYINITNLFSLYNSQSNKLRDSINEITSQLSYSALKEIINSNINQIKNTLNNTDYIVLAWGNCPDNFHQFLYYYQAAEILDYITTTGKNNIYVFRIFDIKRQTECFLTKLGNPVHPINGNLLTLVKVNIDKYKGIEPVG